MRWLMVAMVLIGSGLILAGAQPQDGKKGDEPPFLPASVPAHAVEIAWEDQQKVPHEDRPFMRYIWVSSGVREDVQATAATLGYISRASVPVRPVPVVPSGHVVRVDLRSLAPRAADLTEWLKLWEEFRFDPKFSLLVTRDSLDLIAAFAPDLMERVVKVRVQKKKRIVVKVPPFRHTDGHTYDWDYRDVTVAVMEERKVRDAVRGMNRTDVLRLNPLSIDPLKLAALQEELVTEAPIVHHSYLVWRALSAIKDQGIYRTIYGGLYYEFAGIPKGQKKGQTDEDALFELLGIGNAKETFDRLRSDQRVAVFRSGVTGKPRRVDILRSLSGRDSAGIVSVTHDPKDASVDVGQHPIMNLVEFKDDARELIYERANGFLGYALYDGKGARQDEAPSDVANDRTVPAPHSLRLQPAISCIRCHGGDGSDGWKPLTNDVKRLLKGRADILDDASNRQGDLADVLDRLAGWYAGSPDRLLTRARDDFAAGVLRTTGPWRASKDQTDVVKLSSNRLADIYGNHVYRQVDARQALLELGFDLTRDNDPAKDREKAVAFLQKLLPPDEQARIGDIFPEDPRAAALLAGLALNRIEWDLVYSYVAYRAKREIDRLGKGGGK